MESGRQDARPRDTRQRDGAAGVTRERLLDAALTIVEAEGPDGLTMRGLARKLGVAPTAIYWHVGDRQAVLDALAERIADGIAEVRVSGKEPATRIVSIARSLRRALLDQPELVRLVHQQGHTAAIFVPVRRRLAREFVAAGLRGREAALAVDSVVHLVSGSVLNKIQVDRSPQPRQSSGDLWSVDDVRDSPDVVEHLSRPGDPDEVFEHTLDLLVRGLGLRST
jgi:AcrR family transcriptional regulator